MKSKVVSRHSLGNVRSRHVLVCKISNELYIESRLDLCLC